MKVLIKTVDGKAFTVNASHLDTVGTFKAAVAEATRIPADQQMLVFTGEENLSIKRLIIH